MKKAAILFLVSVVIMLGVTCAQADPEDMYGQIFPDFSVKTISGLTFTLSESLKTHDLVLINFWATWCDPCRMEFPFLETAWEQYSDRVDVIALSIENDDTFEALVNFTDEYDLSFPIGRDDAGFFYGMAGSAIPTTLIVDKERRVVAVEVGSKSSAEEFTVLFENLLSSDPDQNQTQEGDHNAKTQKPETVPELNAIRMKVPDTNKGAAFGFDLTENELITINRDLYEDALRWTESTVPQNLKDFPLIPVYILYYENEAEHLDTSLEMIGNKAVWTSDAESLYSGDFGIISHNDCYGWTQSLKDNDFTRTGSNTYEATGFQNASDVRGVRQERVWYSGDIEYSFSIDFYEPDQRNGGRITLISMDNMENGTGVFWQIDSMTNDQLFIDVNLYEDDKFFSLEYDLYTGQLLSYDDSN